LEREFEVFDVDNEGREKSGLAKAATILATGFGISFGLCGLNVVAVFSSRTGGAGFLGITAYIELAGMIICAAGLVIVGIIAIFKMLLSHREKD
jgi:hypothetical protein